MMVLEVHGGFKEVRSGLQAAGVGLRRFVGGLGRGGGEGRIVEFWVWGGGRRDGVNFNPHSLKLPGGSWRI